MLATEDFTHILRVLNTNVDGKQKIQYALTAIRGIGRRYSNICCKKAEVDLTRRCVRRWEGSWGWLCERGESSLWAQGAGWGIRGGRLPLFS